jgi:hypothetical protein
MMFVGRTLFLRGDFFLFCHFFVLLLFLVAFRFFQVRWLRSSLSFVSVVCVCVVRLRFDAVSATFRPRGRTSRLS